MKGLVFNMPEVDYHARREVSSTWLKTLRKSASKLRDLLDNGRKETKALSDGKPIHSAILEPDSLGDRYVVVPADAPKAPTKVQRGAKKPSDETVMAIRWWDSFASANKGKTFLDADEWRDLLLLRDTAWKHPAVRDVMRSTGKPEVSAFGPDDVTELPMRARFDWLEGGTILDVKSTTDAEDRAFSRDMLKFGYHIQAAHYAAVAAACGRPIDHFIFIVIEKVRPFDLNVLRIHPEAWDRGRVLHRRLLDQFKRCQEAGLWPGYDTSIRLVNLPKYGLTDEAEAEVFYEPEGQE